MHDFPADYNPPYAQCEVKTMKMRARFKRLTFWNKLGAIGAIFSIVGFLAWLLCPQSTDNISGEANSPGAVVQIIEDSLDSTQIAVAGDLVVTIQPDALESVTASVIEESENAPRPWVSIPTVQTYFHADCMDTKFEITNIGQLPAYVEVQVEAYLDGERIDNVDTSKQSGAIAILPGQLIRQEGLGFEGESYKRLRQGNVSQSIVQEIRVKYGIRKEEMDFLTWQRIEFDVDDLPKIVENTNRPGLWNLIDGGFK